MLRQSAYTLIEAIIVLAIISILSLLTQSGLQTILQRAEDNAARDSILRLMQKARAEAVMLRQTLALCKSNDLQQCGGDWSDGQLIFIDRWHDGVIHDAGQIIAVNSMQRSRGKLYVRFYPVYREVMHFNSIHSESNDNGTFWYCRNARVYPAWALQFNRAGSITELKADAEGNIRDSIGKLLTC